MLVAVGVVVAAVVDVRTRRIPNLVTVPMAAAGLALAAIGAGPVGLAASMAGFLLGLLLMLPGHALGATGAGDVKLLAAVGALVGPVQVVMAFLFTALAGGAIAVGVAARRGRLSETMVGTSRLIRAPAGARQTIEAAAPASRFSYGPAIAAGSLIAALLHWRG